MNHKASLRSQRLIIAVAFYVMRLFRNSIINLANNLLIESQRLRSQRFIITVALYVMRSFRNSIIYLANKENSLLVETSKTISSE